MFFLPPPPPLPVTDARDDIRQSRVEIGRNLFKAQKIIQAISYFQEELELGPAHNHASAHYWLAECNFVKKDFELAMTHYNLSIELDDTNFQTFFDRGYLYQKLRYVDQAIIDFTSSINLNPDFVSAYHNRAIAYKTKNNVSAAIIDFRRAIDISGVHLRTKKALVDLLLPRAAEYSIVGRHDEALALLEECVSYFPSNFTALFSRAEAYTRLGQLENAVDDYTLALEQRPRSIDALRGRASLNQQLKRMDEAHADFKLLVALRPSSTFALRGIQACSVDEIFREEPLVSHRLESAPTMMPLRTQAYNRFAAHPLLRPNAML